MHLRPDSESQPSNPNSKRISSWAVVVLVVGAVLLSLLPIVMGSSSLFFRDVLNFHWPAKVEQVRAWREGVLPLVDLWRAGGQPGVGNLNTLPLYLSNLLLLVAGGSLQGLAWAFNAHFWLHLALAPVAFFWLARGMGLRREGAWMAAVLFGSSGFAVSMLGFYNLVAALVLVPILMGALVRIVGSVARPVDFSVSPERPGGKRWAGTFLVLALSWTLLLLAGDPVTAMLGLGAAVVCVVVSGFVGGTQRRPQARGIWAAAGALLAGTLVAWPQLQALLDALQGSVRATLGFSNAGVLRGSFHPALVADSFLPFILGAPNQLFWGERFHGGAQPLFYSFFPGTLVLVLGCVALAKRTRRSSPALLAGLVLVGLGGFVGLGSFNPLVVWFSQWADVGWLRFPVKFWWWVAVGLGFVGGHAFDVWLERDTSKSTQSGDLAGRCRTIRRVSLGFGGAYLTVIFAIAFGWFKPLYERFIGGPGGASTAAEAIPRLLLAASLSLCLCVLVWVLVGFPRFLRQRGWVILVVLHVVSQLVVLRPLYPTLPTSQVVEVPEILGGIPPTALLAHGSVGARFGAAVASSALPATASGRNKLVRDVSVSSVQSSAQRVGYPSAGVTAGYRYQLNLSPEGLDAYLPGLYSQVLKSARDDEKVALLEALGVTHLLVERRLSPGLERRLGPDRLILEKGVEVGRGRVFRYALPRARSILAVTQWVEFASPQQALGVLLDEEFDPRRTVLIAAESGNVDPAPGAAKSAATGRDRGDSATPSVVVEALLVDRHGVRLQTKSEQPIVVALDRTYLPGYRATIDGESVPTTQVNLVRLAVRVPPGDHAVEVFFDRSGWNRSLLVAVSGWLLLLVGVFWYSAPFGPTARGLVQ